MSRGAEEREAFDRTVRFATSLARDTRDTRRPSTAATGVRRRRPVSVIMVGAFALSAGWFGATAWHALSASEAQVGGPGSQNASAGEPGRAFDHRHFTVRLVVSPQQADVANDVRQRLPERWATATLGRSRLDLIPESGPAQPDIYLVLGDEPSGENAGWALRPATGLRLAYIHYFVEPDTERTLQVILHELGHVLGCCSGVGASPNGHWESCLPASVEIMCASGTAATFSDRELAAMSLQP